MKNNSSGFLELLDAYISRYLPRAVGASVNTVKSYKYAFRLLIAFMHQQKKIQADKITFEHLDYETLMAFLMWIEEERGCSVSTKNQRCQHWHLSLNTPRTVTLRQHRSSGTVSIRSL